LPFSKRVVLTRGVPFPVVNPAPARKLCNTSSLVTKVTFTIESISKSEIVVAERERLPAFLWVPSPFPLNLRGE
jgi:hypothetical protein